MTDTSPQPAEVETREPVGPRPGRARWQVGLQTLVLLMVAIAVWTAFFVNRRQIAALESRIAATRPLAHELGIEDVNKIAVVKLDELWYDENQWDIYLPEGKYRLCMATRGIDQNRLGPVVKSAPIAAGKHHLALEQQAIRSGWRITATWDGTGRLVAEESKDWDPGHGSMGGGRHSLSTQLAADQPAVLFRRIFSRSTGNNQFSTPSGPAEGLLLWIEPVAGSNKTP
ncbi:MAG: hypothetical protein JWN86_3103 [Planctomycetota bacterium]|nr:hypothetical protein [Planctomycetota bacterium]